MLSVDAADLTAALDRLLEACDLAPAASQTEAETLGHAIIGLRRNVYDTTPGAYQRTGDLLRGLTSSHRSSGATASVTIGNTEPYALFVELGSGPNGLTSAQAQAYSQAATDPSRPLYFGRSGQRYTIAGPFLAPAQFYALWKLADLFTRAVQRVI